MKQPIDISVIMPTYNCLAYLPQAVNSVLSQNVALELLIVDDGSDDGSAEWLAELERQNSSVRVLKGQHQGVSAARNLAIAQAQGRYVAFLDADDYWYEGKLKQQLLYHETNPAVVLSFTDYDHTSEQGTDLGRCFGFWPRFNRLLPGRECVLLNGALKSSVYEENVIGTSTVMVRTRDLQQLEGFDESLHSASDWDLWLKLLAEGDFLAINQPMMNYLVRQNSISRNVERRLNSFELILKRYQRMMQQLNPGCYGPAFARLQLARAEALQGQKGGYWPAVAAYSRACIRLPSVRNVKAMLAHMLGRQPG